MALVKVKEKYQVTLPTAVRRKVGLGVGDLLEADVKGNVITLTPKSIIDREIAMGLDDIKKGRVSPVFTSAKSLIRHLHREARKLKKKP